MVLFMSLLLLLSASLTQTNKQKRYQPSLRFASGSHFMERVSKIRLEDVKKCDQCQSDQHLAKVQIGLYAFCMCEKQDTTDVMRQTDIILWRNDASLVSLMANQYHKKDASETIRHRSPHVLSG